MNYGTHLHVAYEVTPPIAAERMGEFGLGTMLPDLIAMAGERMDHQALSRRQIPLLRGVKFHKRTDEIFHSQADFLNLRSAVQADLMPLAGNTHRARGWSEVGIELIIDGLMFRSRELRRQYKESMEFSRGVYAQHHVGNLAIAGKRFAEWLSVYAEHGIPRYDTPADVVRSLHRRLAMEDASRRAGSNTRLGFPEGQAKEITGVFQSHLVTIHETGEELVKLTVSALKNPEQKVVKIAPEDPAKVRARVPRYLRGDRRK